MLLANANSDTTDHDRNSMLQTVWFSRREMQGSDFQSDHSLVCIICHFYFAADGSFHADQSIQ